MNIRLSKSFLAAHCVALAAMVTQTHAQIVFSQPTSTFISVSQLDSIYGLGESSPIGITFAGNKFVGSGGYYYTSPQLYQTGLSGGATISTFGSPLPTAGGEVVVAASPGGSPFGSNDIFSGSGGGGQIYQYSNAGGAPTLFATVPTGAVRGISFDTTGLYGDDMIVTTTSGAIYKIAPTPGPSQVTLLADTGNDTEGMSYSTEAFDGFVAGTLFTTSESEYEGPGLYGEVNAILPDGTVVPFVHIDEAESISFVPTDIAGDTNPLDGFYGVAYPQDILFAQMSEFVPYEGDVIVTTEDSGSDPNIWAITSGGTVTGIGYMSQPEDSIFVTNQTLVTHGVGVPDGGNAAALLLAGILSLGALACRRKSGLLTQI